MTRWDGLAGGRGKEGAWSIGIVTVVVEAKNQGGGYDGAEASRSSGR